MLVELVMFIGLFLVLTAVLQNFSSRTGFPYTVALLIVGLLAQGLVHFARLGFEMDLSPNFIYFFLLPILLFESAIHINFHQFRLQFKTISFLATFGLLVSIFATGMGAVWALKIPLGPALLFGALISATDPIAVLALFKSLGAPKRLALLVEGESMLNDATAVIVFRIIAATVLGGTALAASVEEVPLGLINSTSEFAYVFVGSLLLGGALGYATSKAIEQVTNDRIFETTLTVALAISSFVVAEHWLGLSGVIATVAAGIYVGNFGKTKISGGVIKFIEEMWEYSGFFAVSLIFFFTAFNLDVDLLAGSLSKLGYVILIILIARSLAVYTSFYLTNSLPWFRDEPNVPARWQHVINWGGLRGIIPLVLVYTLPDSFVYKSDFLAFTLAAFMFTLLVNALSINWLLAKLKLHLPAHGEAIIEEEMAIFAVEEAERKLRSLPADEFDADVVSRVNKELNKEELKHERLLLKLATTEELQMSLKLQALNIEQSTIERLYELGHINESVYYDLEIELDLQRDALEFPEVASGRGYMPGGLIDTSRSFRKRLRNWQLAVRTLPLVKNFLQMSERGLIEERLSLLKARVVASEAVLDYLERVKGSFMSRKRALQSIKAVKREHMNYIKSNETKLKELEKQYPRITKDYQKRLVYTLISNK